MLDFEIDAKIENLHSVFDRLTEELKQLDCGDRTINQCKLCAEEIFMNVASYAYNPETGKVRITLEDVRNSDERRLVFTFSDKGTPYDPLSAKDPDINAELEDREIGGLGVFLVKSTMDDVSYKYTDGQNVLRFEKVIG